MRPQLRRCRRRIAQAVLYRKYPISIPSPAAVAQQWPSERSVTSACPASVRRLIPATSNRAYDVMQKTGSDNSQPVPVLCERSDLHAAKEDKYRIGSDFRRPSSGNLW